MKVLRVGVIGAGKMGLSHIRAISSLKQAHIVGVADPLADVESLQPLLPADAIVATSTDELFERARPDVVHIVTPPHTHTRLAEIALDRGVHVYVEKPFTLTRAEAASVISKAETAGLQVCAGHQCLFQPQVTDARKVLHEIGRLVHVESYFSFRQVRRSMRPVDQAKDILPHAVYTLLELMRAGTPGIDPASVVINGLDVREDGSVYALLDIGGCRGVLVVTLTGRPVQHYANLVGRNGSLRIDFGTASTVKLAGPGVGAATLLAPYRVSMQTLTGATRGIAGRIRNRKLGYPGLSALASAFYDGIISSGRQPLSNQSILDTVSVCETIGRSLDAANTQHDEHHRTLLRARAAELSPPVVAGVAFVTGATGFLGREVVSELKRHGWAVRAAARNAPRYADRVPGVEYVTCDLARGLDPGLFTDVGVILHCAAETAGGKSEQQRNSIDATRRVIEAARAHGINRVVHISSLAVLKPGGLVNESTSMAGELRRGPYVWGKAASENVAVELGRELDVDVAVLRLGPLVDFEAFQPPGRLGRELAPLYVAVGPRRRVLSLCRVGTAAQVIRLYAGGFENLPRMVNLVEPVSPTRADLVDRLRATRKDLRVVWLPFWVLRVASPVLSLVQRVMGTSTPVDVASAFTAERYNTDVAASVIARAQTPEPRVPDMATASVSSTRR